MAERGTLLVVDAGAERLDDLCGRLRDLGYRALRAKTVDEGLGALADPRFAVGAVLAPPDLPAYDLERTLRAFRLSEPDAPLPLLAVGPEPECDVRDRLRSAGVEWALWRPIHDHTLRFQVNRALAGDPARANARRWERVPTPWSVSIGVGAREKPGSVYSLSAQGAYLETDRPSLPSAIVHVALPLPGGEIRVTGSVVMTNVPGNLSRRTLPVGMGVRFAGHAGAAKEALREWVLERAAALLI